MSAEPPDPAPSEEWEPATSQPGQIFTPEGQVAAAGAFARGWSRRSKRGAAYRRSMMAGVLICIAIAFVIVAIAIALD